jgi:hypothetical protein
MSSPMHCGKKVLWPSKKKFHLSRTHADLLLLIEPLDCCGTTCMPVGSTCCPGGTLSCGDKEYCSTNPLTGQPICVPNDGYFCSDGKYVEPSPVLITPFNTLSNAYLPLPQVHELLPLGRWMLWKYVVSSLIFSISREII